MTTATRGRATAATGPGRVSGPGRWLRRLRLPLAVVATVALVGTLGWFWYDSRVPSTYSVMDMGYVDTGGGPAAGGHGAAHHGGVSVADLTGPADERPAVSVTLTARRERLTLATGEQVDGYTLNHTSPGPEIRARQGELIEVRLRNENVGDGAALHWHGVAVPNAEDGVAGVTQDAVPPGGSHVYRFRVDQPGSYWYHSHQVSHEQVRRGMWGPLVIEPAGGTGDREVLAAVHDYDGRQTINGHTGVRRVEAAPGERLRVRVVNTDSSLMRVTVTGAPYQVVAVDARDVNRPTDLTGVAVAVPAGGRADLAVTVPAAGGEAVRVDAGAGAAVLLGPAGAAEPPAAGATGTVDLLSYGSPAPTGIDAAAADRRFALRIGRRPGFLNGRPGLWWTMNGRMFPDVPMYLVREGDLAVMTISNSSGDGHPMHLHGHHVLVLSRDGEQATGSPWWTDSLQVANGQTYQVAFRADNPGIWMDHCHQLPHAAEGMMVHLAYEGVSTPYRVGGDAGNEPE